MDDLALLRLQMEWGADEALAADPVDRLRDPAPITVRPRPSASARVGSTAPERISLVAVASGATPAIVAATEVERAMRLAGQAGSLEALREAVVGCDFCALRDTASNLVFAEGDPAGGLLVIGPPPGVEEDRSGHPIAGSEGVLFDRMLASIDLSRPAILCTPLIPWRPPGGRAPYAGEMGVCLPFLHRLIVLAAPRRLVLLGVEAVRAVLPDRGRRRRTTQEWESARIPGHPDPLPALVLPGLMDIRRDALRRRNAWAGLRLLRRSLDADLTKT